MVRFSWLVKLIWRLRACFFGCLSWSFMAQSTTRSCRAGQLMVAWCPGKGVNKVEKPCINSTWIASLINGFLSVKTWLLITCGTSIYAIIHIHEQYNMQTIYSTVNVLFVSVHVVYSGMFSCENLQLVLFNDKKMGIMFFSRENQMSITCD